VSNFRGLGKILPHGQSANLVDCGLPIINRQLLALALCGHIAARYPGAGARWGVQPTGHGHGALVPGVLRDLVTNLASGARLALMLPVGRDDFRRSRDQAVLVIGVWLSTILVIDYVSVDPVREFNSYAVGYFAARLLSVLLGTYLIARIQGASHSCAALVIYIMSASPIAWIVGCVIYASGTYDAIITTDEDAWAYFYAFVAWDLIVALRAVRIEYIVRPARVMVILAIYSVCTVTPLFELEDEYFWYTASEDEPSEQIDIEQTYYRAS
jgi:hypothetical protein